MILRLPRVGDVVMVAGRVVHVHGEEDHDPRHQSVEVTLADGQRLWTNIANLFATQMAPPPLAK